MDESTQEPTIGPAEELRRLQQLTADMLAGWRDGEWGQDSSVNFRQFLTVLAEDIDALPYPYGAKRS